MNCLIIAGLVIANIGWVLVLYLVAKCHLETKDYSESDLIELKDIITLKENELYKTIVNYREAVINDITSDIRCGLNGLANRLDDMKPKLDNLIDSKSYNHNPQPEKYHNQNVRVGNQTEERLRELIDALWQKAHAHEAILTDDDYEELALIQRNLSAMLVKASKGMWKESKQRTLNLQEKKGE